MIEVIVNAQYEARIKKRHEILSGHDGEIIVLDDMTATLAGLEGYAYPSLFSDAMPIVHSVYVLEVYGSALTKELLTTLVASPTLFLFEEKILATALIKTIEKEGGIVHRGTEVKVPAKAPTIFAVTNALTAVNKKERWLAYQKSLTEHSAEALIGILYWKLRQLIEQSGSTTSSYKTIYRALMSAHKHAWQQGTPLALAIEKVILEQ